MHAKVRSVAILVETVVVLQTAFLAVFVVVLQTAVLVQTVVLAALVQSVVLVQTVVVVLIVQNVAHVVILQHGATLKYLKPWDFMLYYVCVFHVYAIICVKNLMLKYNILHKKIEIYNI